MTAKPLEHFAIQTLLEQRFQECLTLARNLQREVETSLDERKGPRPLLHEYILSYLQEFTPMIYKIIGRTLFQLIPLLQPEDCEGEELINFYFWPGYHSYLADKRIFIRRNSWNLGIGVCGAPGGADATNYDECSQARLYHYLIKPINKSAVTPGDVHQWLRLQQPQHSNRFVSSLTVTTEPPDPGGHEEFPDHQVLSLAGKSDSWGERFADFVNSLDRNDPGWKFPDRRSSSAAAQIHLRHFRAKLHAVWLHAALRQSKPEWLEDFIDELLEDERVRDAGRALKRALKDGVAKDWKDGAGKRPRFRCWSYLSLHGWLAPTLGFTNDPNFSESNLRPQTEASTTVGSAEFLSSVPMRPLYFAYVRLWLSAIYGMVRNAEISILLNSQQANFESARLAGPYFAHELKKLIDAGSTMLLREAGQTSREAVRNRRFMLYSLCNVSNLAYKFTNATLSGDLKAIEREKDDFLKPLRRLHRGGTLLPALQYVAEQVYASIAQAGHGQVSFSKLETIENLREDEHRSCFLLVAEMISDYCEHEQEDSVARWSAVMENDSLVIRLVGPTRAQRNPASMTFARLNVFLRALDIGEAKVDWAKEEQQCTYSVRVDYAPSEVGPGEGDPRGGRPD